MIIPGRRAIGILLIAVLVSAAVVAQDAATDAETDTDVDTSFEVDAGADTDVDDIFANPFGDSDDEDSVSLDDADSFFQDDMLEKADEGSMDAAPQDELLTADELRWGGRISGSASAEWSWGNVWTPSFDPLDAESDTLSPSVTASLFFDARPDPAFRVFGKLKFQTSADQGTNFQAAANDAALTGDLPEGWTREEDEDGDTVIRDADGDIVFTVPAEDEEEDEPEPQTGTAPAIDMNVFELFSDFSYADRLFFRFGKHTIKWGLGYFWSPADVLNLTAIDAEDPTADREGPISLKTHFPFGINNAYLYTIINANTRPTEAALAPKVELVVGASELSLAAYYQRALSPRVIGMVSSSLDDIDLFGEAVLSFGSDRTFVRRSRKEPADFEDPPEDLEVVLDTYTIDTLPLFSGTAGLRYVKDFENNAGSLALIGQYYFNGEGYPDSSLLKPAYLLAQNPNTNGLAIADEDDQPDGYEAPPDLAFADLTNWGRHYAAVSANWSSIADSDFSVGVLTIANLSDLSGIISPNVSVRLFEHFSLSVSGRYTYGDPGDEFTNQAALLSGTEDESDTGGTLALTVQASLGGGSF